jgi:hypothetical protein
MFRKTVPLLGVVLLTIPLPCAAKDNGSSCFRLSRCLFKLDAGAQIASLRGFASPVPLQPSAACVVFNPLLWGVFALLFFTFADFPDLPVALVRGPRMMRSSEFWRDLLRPSRFPTSSTEGIGVEIFTERAIEADFTTF